jgi:hypothetical protein
MAYAQNTRVSIESSRAEIEKRLIKFGATSFASAWDSARGRAEIGFTYEKLHIRFRLQLPDRNEGRFTHVTSKRIRSKDAQEVIYNQEVRRLWRALLLIVKAKIESVNSGVSSVENEFLSYIVANSAGETVGEIVIPRLMTGTGFQLPARGQT